ncbi:MAG: hypothetical protein K2P93_04680 [Alphaproteobacteria bacterium]|nr:hypothetical protein [Alphaproteobacteria bacterium]
MRTLLLLIIGFCLPAFAQDTSTPSIEKKATVESSQKKTKADSGKEDIVESTTLCDPREETRMPETFN